MSVIERFSIMPSWKDDGQPGSNRDGKPTYRRNGKAASYDIAGSWVSTVICASSFGASLYGPSTKFLAYRPLKSRKAIPAKSIKAEYPSYGNFAHAMAHTV